MANTEVLDYIRRHTSQGLSKDAIRNNLIAGGWAESDINEAFAVAANAGATNVPQAPGAAPGAVKYAGFWIRWVALMVDSLIVSIGVFLVQVVIVMATGAPAGGSAPSRTTYSISQLVYLIVTWAYFALMTHYQGATLGKMLVGITVKSDDLGKLPFGRVLLRETVGKLVSGIILAIGYIMAAFTQKKQALHDKFAHSVVVYKDPAKQNSAGLIVGIVIAAILPMIVIFGILSSVVLVSLGDARDKAKDARARAGLFEIRTAAEIYYSQHNNSYSTAKNCNSGMFLDERIRQLTAVMPPDRNLTCTSYPTSFAVSVDIASPKSTFCVDSVGFSKSGTVLDDGSSASCKP